MNPLQELAAFSPSMHAFVLVLLRAGIFMSMLPVFGSKSFPLQFKIGLAVAFAALLSPIVHVELANIPLPVLVMREAALGIILGATARAVFFAVDMGGQMISNAMGLSIATVFNPEMGQSTEIGRIYGIIAMLIVLAIDGHHELISVFVQSYDWLPIGQVNVQNLILKVVSAGSKIFVIALKISAPVLVGMLIVNILMGFLYKAAPQVNIFFVSFPVFLALGFLIMAMSVPVFTHFFAGQFHDVNDELFRILAIARK
ncbi:MAG: flagellar biosynthetic protein FliR [Nitrospirae bacterium]|nr:flagellar biosynthetic protein FliR [Nitrospirota bacterium]